MGSFMVSWPYGAKPRAGRVLAWKTKPNGRLFCTRKRWETWAQSHSLASRLNPTEIAPLPPGGKRGLPVARLLGAGWHQGTYKPQQHRPNPAPVTVSAESGRSWEWAHRGLGVPRHPWVLANKV